MKLYNQYRSSESEFGIHPTAIVDSNAKVSEKSYIGPFCIIGPDVKINDNVALISSVTVQGSTEIDEGTVVYPYSTIGLSCQDLKYKGEETKVYIGKNNSIREHTTIHAATTKEVGGNDITKIGDNCLLMVGSHVAHDVIVGNNVIIANNTLLAGHVEVGNGVIIGGGSAIQQHSKLGDNCFVGGLSGVVNNIVPFAMTTGIREDSHINGINIVGLKRKGYQPAEIKELQDAYGIIFSGNPIKESIEEIQDKYKGKPLIDLVLDFIVKNSNNLCLKYKR